MTEIGATELGKVENSMEKIEFAGDFADASNSAQCEWNVCVL